MTVAAIGIVLAAGALYLWFRERARRLSSDRLASLIGKTAGTESRGEPPLRTIRSFPPRYRFAAYSVGVVLAAALWLIVGLPMEVAAAAGILAGVLAYLVEDHIGDQKAAMIEAQLAAAIYLMVGSLRAGASLLAAFESALEEVGPPLRPYFRKWRDASGSATIRARRSATSNCTSRWKRSGCLPRRWPFTGRSAAASRRRSRRLDKPSAIGSSSRAACARRVSNRTRRWALSCSSRTSSRF